MWRFRRKDGKASGRGGAAVAEPPGDFAADYHGTTAQLREEIDRLTAANREHRDVELDRRLLWLRHVLGVRALDEAAVGAEFATPDVEGLPAADGLPELTRDAVTPGVLRAGILRDGCVLVRGLVGREPALRFGDRIDRAFAECDRALAGQEPADGLYEEFRPHLRAKGVLGRSWIHAGGGVLAADSPTLAFEMLELFREAELAPLVNGYLGEPALISAHKTTLRKAAPSVPGAWHQDGSFMGAVRSLNLWLSLSRCGDVAPGLDLVPRRLDHLVATQTDEAVLEIQVAQTKVEEAAAGVPIIRPIFEPGDALFFDEMFLHQTGSDPSMPNPRFAIESWFFGSSSFPADYAPVAPW